MVTNLENEVWKSVVGYEDVYSVSNLGRVKAYRRKWESGVKYSITRKKPEVLIFQNTSRGYKRVVLTQDGKPKSCNVHRLVAIAFLPNPENKAQVNHLNGVKDDNRLENLEWATPSENALHSYRIGLNVSAKRKRHPSARKIACDTLGLLFYCIRDAGDFLGVDYTTIWHICNGRKIQSQGLTFKYV